MNFVCVPAIITGSHTTKTPGDTAGWSPTINREPWHAGGMTEGVRPRFAFHGGVRIAYELHDRAGADQPWVCLIHGLGYGRWGWQPVVGPLAERFRVAVFEEHRDDFGQVAV